MAPGGGSRGAGGYRGTKRHRGNTRPQAQAQPAPPPPTAPGPLHDLALLGRTYKNQLAPGSKYLENPKGVIANYVKHLGLDPVYQSHRVAVDGKLPAVYRATIVADPDPPPPVQRSLGYNSGYASGPTMPPLAVPVVGTGDAPTAKEAEKLAAIDACLQLSTRGLFNKVGTRVAHVDLSIPRGVWLTRCPRRHLQSNLPTRSVNLYATSASAPIARAGPTYDTAAPTASSATSAFWDGPSAGGSAYQSSANQYVPPPPSVVAPPQQQQAGGGLVPGTNDGRRVVLQNGAIVGLEEARAFMDYYCRCLAPFSESPYDDQVSP